MSDTTGRENTMFIAFGTAALMLLTLSAYGYVPVVFVLAIAVYFGVFGEIYSLFPATCDTFGSKFATTNNGKLPTAKGTASLLVVLASVISTAYGWKAVFVVAVALNAMAALTALFVRESKPALDDWHYVYHTSGIHPGRLQYWSETFCARRRRASSRYG